MMESIFGKGGQFEQNNTNVMDSIFGKKDSEDAAASESSEGSRDERDWQKEDSALPAQELASESPSRPRVMRTYFNYASPSDTDLRFVVARSVKSTFWCVYAVEPKTKERFSVLELYDSVLAREAMYLCVNIANGMYDEEAARAACERFLLAIEKYKPLSDVDAVFEAEGRIQRALVDSARDVPLTQFGTLLCDRRDIKAMFIVAEKAGWRVVADIGTGLAASCFFSREEAPATRALEQYRRLANAQFVNPVVRKDFNSDGSIAAAAAAAAAAAGGSGAAPKPKKQKQYKRVVRMVPKDQLTKLQQTKALKRKQAKLDAEKAKTAPADDNDDDEDVEDKVAEAALSDFEEVEDFITDDEEDTEDEGSRDHETDKRIANPREFKDQQTFAESMDKIALSKAEREGLVQHSDSEEEYEDDDDFVQQQHDEEDEEEPEEEEETQFVGLRTDIAIDSDDDDDATEEDPAARKSESGLNIVIDTPVKQSGDAAEQPEELSMDEEDLEKA